MTFRIEPFSSGYSNALIQAGQVPNMAEAYAAGEKQARERNRLLAQQQASEMMAAGDEAGATNLLLSVADPGEGLRYQIARQNAAAEASRTAVADQRYAEAQAQHDREWKIANDRAEQDQILQRRAAARAERADAYKTLPFGTPLPGDQGAPPDPYAPQQPVPPPVTMTPDRPIPPPSIVSPQTGNLDTGVADVPLNPQNIPEFGMGGGRPGPSSAIAQAVQPPAQPSAAAPPPQQAPAAAPQPTAPAASAIAQQLTNDPDKQRRIDDVIKAGGTRDDVFKILTEPQRANPPAPFQMEQGMAKEFNDQTAEFQKRAGAYRDFNRSFELATDEKNPNPAAQLSAIYAFVKANDPTGAVLNGDVSMLEQHAAGFMQQLQNMYPKWTVGSALPREALINMKRTVDAKFGDAFQRYQTYELQQRNIAAGHGLNPYNAIPDVTFGVRPETYQGDELPGEQQGGGYQPGQTGSGVMKWMDQFMQRWNQRVGPLQ